MIIKRRAFIEQMEIERQSRCLTTRILIRMAFMRSHYANDIIEKFTKLDGQKVTIAGRLMTIQLMERHLAHIL